MPLADERLGEGIIQIAHINCAHPGDARILVSLLDYLVFCSDLFGRIGLVIP